MPYSRLDSNLPDSSLWSEALHVRVVFMTFLAKKDQDGVVHGARSGLIRACNVTTEQYDDAIRVLSDPDPESKNPENEGRRVEVIPGGVLVLNHESYRLPEDQKRAKTRERVRQHRLRKQSVTSEVTHSNSLKRTPPLPDLEPDHDSDLDLSSSSSVVEERSTNTASKPKTWRTDYDTYLADEEEGYSACIGDPKWLEDMARLNKRVDILLSLEKARRYWRSEEGWDRKKKRRSVKTLNWRLTYENSLSQSWNRVYHDRDERTETFLT